jgi:cell fate regulator YaaT (PSP1 superfamily)
MGGNPLTNVVSVRFRGGCKTYYFDPRDLTVAEGDYVVVETAQGQEYALCAEGNHEVNDDEVVQPLRAVTRLATENDCRTVAYNRQREKEAFGICQKKILAHGLDMKLVRVECSFEGNKILFFFTSENRVDFRELVKDLASVFRARIELRQIGVRDEAKMLGGLGICGRPFCCNAFLDDFIPVSIKMAKTQNLSLNPTKISGTCGRLMCCLKYEQNAYEDAVKRLPKNDSFVQTPDGVGNVSNLDVLRERVTVRLDTQPEAPKCYHNCEICVLRNGKGNRDGIQIPEKRPERYVEKTEVESDPLLTAFSDLMSDVPQSPVTVEEVPTTGEDKPHRRRSRGGRGRRKPDAPRAEATPDGAKPAARPTPKLGPKLATKPGPKPTGTEASAEKRAAGEAPRRRHRGGRRHGGGKGPAPQGGTQA